MFTETTDILRYFDLIKILYVFLNVLKELDFNVVTYQLEDIETKNFFKFFKTMLRLIIFFLKCLTSTKRNY